MIDLAYAGLRPAEALLARAGEVTGRPGARPLDGEAKALARRARWAMG